jgi:hypothetical protein
VRSFRTSPPEFVDFLRRAAFLAHPTHEGTEAAGLGAQESPPQWVSRNANAQPGIRHR